MELDISGIFERISDKIGAKSGAELATALGITRAGVSNAKAQNRINLSRIVSMCLENGWSLDEVIAGKPAKEAGADLEDAIKTIQNAGGTVTFPPKV